MDKKSNVLNVICFIFGIVFFVIGVLNVFLVDLVPGVLYIILSLIYFPHTDTIFKRKFNFSISYKSKIILGIVILWGTLAVGDLAEMFGL